MNYTKGDYTQCLEHICEIWYEDNLYCIVRTEDADKILEVLNENEQLKQFKENVFDLIDARTKAYEHKPFSAPVGQPMSVNFDADMDRLARLSELQDLEKELKE